MPNESKVRSIPSVDGISLDFTKAFNTISQSILLDEMSNTQLDKHVM